MNGVSDSRPALEARGVCKSFRRRTGEEVRALDRIALAAPRGSLTAIVGPDGAGKTTLLRLAAGLLSADAGTMTVLDRDAAAEPQAIQNRIGYMPQRFGLYEDLTARENLDLYADLHGVPPELRRERYPRLLEMTALGPFIDRLAGRMSGGMKQKLGLACTLVSAPEMLLLDEPTVGVDPLSRRDLWDIVSQLVREVGLTVVLATPDLGEAEKCDRVAVLLGGKLAAAGPPESISGLARGRTFLVEPGAGEALRTLQGRLQGEEGVIDAVPDGGRVRIVRAEAGPDAVPPRLEDGFMVMTHGMRRPNAADEPRLTEEAPQLHGGSRVVGVRELVRRFGAFTAVDRISFDVRRGEIFGLLGPNGAGKTTTFRMLCGLLPASGGSLEVAGVDLRTARASARQRIGYVAQKFALYGPLSVAENLDFFASAYGLRGARKRERVARALDRFDLRAYARLPAGQLPGGYQRRLAMAAALLHDPEVLFLDEPTSGADPVARREFWQRINALAAQGVTVIVTTHLMAEAEYCDRVAILDSGRILAQGSPGEIRRRGGGPGTTMEHAFLAIVAAGRAEGGAGP